MENTQASNLIENRYSLLQQINREKAKEIEAQTGVIFKFPGDTETIEAVLGRGAFGELRIGFDEQEKKYVGIKVIKGKEAVAESQQEATLQNALKGKPNIMQLYHFVQASDELLYQIMPLAGLGSVGKLKVELAKLNDAKLKELILLHIAQGLLIGLWAMHKEHIYHLDKKPDNLVVDAEGNIAVIDFGCAVKSENGKICAPNTKGDHSYLAPERWIAELEAENAKTAFCDGAKIDLWAAGITLLELLSNQNPFNQWRMDQANDAGKIGLENYVTETLANIPELQNPDEQSLWALIKNLLELDPAKRTTALQALNSSLFTENPDIHNPQIMQTAITYLKTFVKHARFEVKFREDPQHIDSNNLESTTHYKQLKKTSETSTTQISANYKTIEGALEPIESIQSRYKQPTVNRNKEETEPVAAEQPASRYKESRIPAGKQESQVLAVSTTSKTLTQSSADITTLILNPA